MGEVGVQIGGVEHWVHDYGVGIVTLILTLESMGLPLPGEILLIVAAILAGRGDLSLPALLFFAWLGAVMGDNIGYLIGRVLGRAVVLRYADRVGLSREWLHKIEAMFARYGPLTVGLARFVNVLRQLNGVVAGTLQMEWRQFLVFNSLGGALWVSLWGFGGFFLGERVFGVANYAHDIGLVAAIVIVVVLIVVVTRILRRRRAGG